MELKQNSDKIQTKNNIYFSLYKITLYLNNTYDTKSYWSFIANPMHSLYNDFIYKN